MTDFRPKEIRVALRDFIKTELLNQRKTNEWLVKASGLSKKQLEEQYLADNLPERLSPHQETIASIFEALDKSYQDFQQFFHENVQVNNAGTQTHNKADTIHHHVNTTHGDKSHVIHADAVNIGTDD